VSLGTIPLPISTSSKESADVNPCPNFSISLKSSMGHSFLTDIAQRASSTTLCYDPLDYIMRLSRSSTGFTETGMKPSLDALIKS
jgi:hypothetical protein